MAFNPVWADAIAKIESGGNYGILGPVTKSGDRAYGKYQVMGNNVPVWTKEILGKSLTPQEFLASPEAQDAVFQGKFGQYAEKYGPEGAAQAWFGGPGAVGQTDRKDQLGTSVGKYGQMFMAGIGDTSALPPSTGQAPSLEPPKPLPPQPLNLAQGNDKMDFLTALMGMLGQGGSGSLGATAGSSVPALGGGQQPFQLPAFGWTPQQRADQAQMPQQPEPAPPQPFRMPIAPPIHQMPDFQRIAMTLANLPQAIRPYNFRG